MNKAEARRIHAHFDASNRLAVVMPPAMFGLFVAMGVPLAYAVALLGASMAFVAMVFAVSTDMMSRRIPNGLSLLALAAAPVWWSGYLLGSTLPEMAGSGVAWTIMAPLYGQNGSGAILPALSGIGYPARMVLDLAMMVAVFIPLFASFVLGLGFGGGDVKLMTALSLFFGWPLGMDFFFLTFIIGGIFSVFVITGRIFSRGAISVGMKNAVFREWSGMREFPFAPAIGIAAVICFAIKLQGLN